MRSTHRMPLRTLRRLQAIAGAAGVHKMIEGDRRDVWWATPHQIDEVKTGRAIWLDTNHRRKIVTLSKGTSACALT